MSRFGKKDAFQERLDRIEQERLQRDGATPEATATDTPRRVAPVKKRKAAAARVARPDPTKATGRRKGVGMVAIASVLFGAVVLGGTYGVNSLTRSLDVPIGEALKETMTNLVARKPTPDSFDGLKGSGPKEHKLYDTGWVMPHALVASGRGPGVALQTIATAAPAPAEGASRPPMVRFANNMDCTLRRPRPGEIVHNVNVNKTGHFTDTHAFSKEELAKATTDRVEGLLAHSRHYKNAAIARGRMGQIDVFVTDTSAPVYLALQVFGSDVMWNIHLAPGVTLAHVAMIGRKSGFAAPEGDFTFEALRISDFVDEGILYDNAEQRDCMVAPWRAVGTHWPLLKKQDDTHSAHVYRDQLRANREGYAAYSAWYRSKMGVTPDTNLVSALIASHALAGPVPERPVAMTPLSQRRVHMAQSDFVAFSTEELNAMHVDLLTAAAGGDLNSISPGVMEAQLQ